MTLDEIERLAKAATKPVNVFKTSTQQGHGVFAQGFGDAKTAYKFAAFLSACDPQTILFLIACVRAGDALRHRRIRSWEAAADDYDTARAALDAAEGPK